MKPRMLKFSEKFVIKVEFFVLKCIINDCFLQINQALTLEDQLPRVLYKKFIWKGPITSYPNRQNEASCCTRLFTCFSTNQINHIPYLQLKQKKYIETVTKIVEKTRFNELEQVCECIYTIMACNYYPI